MYSAVTGFGVAVSTKSACTSRRHASRVGKVGTSRRRGDRTATPTQRTVLSPLTTLSNDCARKPLPIMTKVITEVSLGDGRTQDTVRVKAAPCRGSLPIGNAVRRRHVAQA